MTSARVSGSCDDLELACASHNCSDEVDRNSTDINDDDNLIRGQYVIRIHSTDGEYFGNLREKRCVAFETRSNLFARQVPTRKDSAFRFLVRDRVAARSFGNKLGDLPIGIPRQCYSQVNALKPRVDMMCGCNVLKALSNSSRSF